MLVKRVRFIVFINISETQLFVSFKFFVIISSNMEQISLNLEQDMAEQTLKVIETNEKNLQNSHEQSHRLITYKRQGSSLPIYVSDLYLQQRVKNMIDEGKMTPQDQLVSQHEEQTRCKKRKHRTRYFQTPLIDDKIRQVRCYRCGNHGHTMKYCQAENQDNECMFCLGQHNQNNCNTKSCFLCNQTGHIAKQCKAPKTRCRKCGNKGHSEQECGVIVFLNSTGIRFDKKFREQYGMEDLMKIRCLAQCKFPVGHFNCHQYEDIRQKFYSQAHIEKTIVRENYILSNVSKLRETYYKAQIAKESRKSKEKTDRIEVSNQTMVKQDNGIKMATQS